MKYLFLCFSLFLASCSTDGEFTVVPDLTGVNITESIQTITVFEGVLDGVESVFYFDETEPLQGYTCLTFNNVDFYLYLQTDILNPVLNIDNTNSACDPYTYSLTVVTDSDLPLVGF